MVRAIAIWALLAAVAFIPLWQAGLSPLLAWRDPTYIVAGFSGVIGLIILFFQPLLAGRMLPNVSPLQHHKLHRVTGTLLVLAVVIHVVGLWLTSPPDVVDALLFASPTPFSAWGVIAMWAVFATAIIATMKRRMGLTRWRRIHKGLAIIIVLGTVVHAVLIQGTMETITKWMLCVIVAGVTLAVLTRQKY